MVKQPRNNVLLWLLVFNVIAITFLGGKYLYSAMRDRQEHHKQVLAAANITVRMGSMNIADATRLAELSDDLEHGAKLSDADLDWCLNKLKGQEPSPQSALSRREDVDMTLSEAVKVMDSPQKEKLFQALTTQLTGDNPSEEIGIDVRLPAHILGKLGDKRAIPILATHLNDPRPMVHQTVQKALNRLEGKAVK